MFIGFLGFIESSCPFLSCFRKRLHCPAPNVLLVWHVQMGKVSQRLQSSSCSLFCPELTQFHEVFRYLWRLPAHSAWVCTPREQYITPGKEDGSNSVACIPCSAPLGRNLPIVVRRPLLTQHRRCLARM